MGYQNSTTGTALSEAYLDEEAKQSVMVYATTAARTADAALSAAVREGMFTYLSDQDCIDYYDGTAWRRFSGGRVGVDVRRNANQSIPNSADTAISWDTEVADTHGFIAVTAATITVPTGYGGVYAIMMRLTAGAAWFNNSTYRAWILITGGTTYIHPSNPSTTEVTCPPITAIVPLAAGNTVEGHIIQASGGAVNFTGALSMYRLSG